MTTKAIRRSKWKMDLWIRRMKLKREEDQKDHDRIKRLRDHPFQDPLSRSLTESLAKGLNSSRESLCCSWPWPEVSTSNGKVWKEIRWIRWKDRRISVETFLVDRSWCSTTSLKRPSLLMWSVLVVVVINNFFIQINFVFSVFWIVYDFIDIKSKMFAK